jgi:outer membrane lipoprotein carrier protein
MTPIRFLAGLCALLVAGIAHAGAREQFDQFSKGVQGLSSRFEQSVFASDGELRETSSGSVKLQAPRLFRWEYERPFPQLLVADGDHIWIYEPDMEQVTVRRQSLEEQNSPLAMLIDPAELERQFKVAEDGESQGQRWLLLTPRKPDDAPFEKARLGFSAQGLASMEMYDSLGQRTLMAFSPWQRNPRFAADTFVFVTPPGVDQVGEVAESAEVIPLAD